MATLGSPSQAEPDMTVVALWRHPVKSLGGEALVEAEVDDDGLRGDRSWGIRDDETGRILTARREPRLLEASASLDADGEPIIQLPDQSPVRGLGAATDAALSGWLGKPVTLVRATEQPPATAEFFVDATDDDSLAVQWTMPPGRFVDAMPLLVLTTASLRTAAAHLPAGEWDVRRFRPNVLVEVHGDGWVEDTWYGRQVQIGSATIGPREPCQRCTMVTRPQPGLVRDLDIYRTLARHHAGTFGAWSAVERSGGIRVGDRVTIE
jgi:uncharacterized protein YcbX